MSKAILILDKMPRNCWECDPHRCRGYERDLDWDSENRPDFCPLRELPELNTSHYINNSDFESLPVEYKLVSKYMTGFEDGWNACLDEILGKKE